MVRRLEDQGIRDRRVLEAIGAVPRHLFVREHLRGQAYTDRALPISAGQTISQPWVVARMTELLAVGEDHSVLEVGTGSGYQTALLAHLARRVYSLEILGELARGAIRRLASLRLDNVKIQTFDGTVGWNEAAPFDRILVTAGAPAPPPPLLAQLTAGGRLVLPEGERHRQQLVAYRRLRRGFQRTVAEEVSFVPLLGRHGWSASGEAR
jgi:protein-L-isoaspartate(D-aspartate) O-methyltransferase